MPPTKFNFKKSKYSKHNDKIIRMYTGTDKMIKAGTLAKILAKNDEEITKTRSFAIYIAHYIKHLEENEPDVVNFTRLKDEAGVAKINHRNVPYAWIKDEGVSYFYRNPHFKEEDREEMFREVIEDLKKYSPKIAAPKYYSRKEGEERYCLVIDPADIHVGKLAVKEETGSEYNTSVAIERAIEGVEGILDKSKGWKIDQIVFIAGNDILHTDNPKRTTTSGTPQDTHGMWYQNFLAAKDLYVRIMEILVGVAPVHFVFNPSNHDYASGFFLSNVIQAYFRRCHAITFDTTMAHRKYYKYHSNLIGSTHGDGAKSTDLGKLMAYEAKKDWADTDHHYVYTHHVHHKMAKDDIGITIESLRSPSGTDSWHARNGYTGAPKAVEGFVHCKKNGQVARLTHIFQE
jgi:hypothetical protein